MKTSPNARPAQRIRRALTSAAIGIGLALALAAAAQAQTFSLDWWTVDGGGGQSTGGVYTVTGTLGQPDPGRMSGGEFTLEGGFWGGFAQPIELPKRPFATPNFYVHGYLDQVGQATAPDGDPAYVFKQFGRDIANAVREDLLP